MGQKLSWLKDLLFPKFCVVCSREAVWLCEGCLPKNIVLENFTFELEKDRRGLDGLTALFSYGVNPASELIKMLKYNYITEVTRELRRLIFAACYGFNWQGFVIVPVPLHPRRERERGFNQAELIAQLFAEKLNLEMRKNLQRSIYTRQQAILSGEERRANLNGAFTFNIDGRIVPEKVLLVDDVFTTGSTMKECAKSLKDGGVKTVWGLVLAKG